ncbi:hypothetical protein PHLGIDRAFT_34227 [Phlebiopsis gigantea 11061_1 CR5-6]|uniref:Uncharacterized protein n=1 Tax=Phlebiopsis gigantea (strain 11061_1 CR5-6) TaxID=745531 RepID=A0A0C3PRL4_PHLG1|nr:hypothetical protein PHLGIDRAFT_34227 [Phlebiopsis gigantea 11061_1 CR5-6]
MFGSPPLHTQPQRQGAALVPTPTFNRRSTPPPKLNLGDCSSSLVTTTTTNTSTNAASKPSTAFVFTSSRTIRTLHSLSHPADDAPLLPSEPIPSPSPASSPDPAKSEQRARPHKAPSLSSAQLARHSVGAFDARCVVSSSMRAAGFVPLTQTSAHRLSTSSTPPLPLVPTPADPPRFPPIVFVSPTNVASASFWDYQRTLPYGLPTGRSDNCFYGSPTSPMRPSLHPMPKAKEGSDSSGSSYMPDVASSASSLFSNPSSSQSSMTSTSPHSQDEEEERPLAQRLDGLALHDHFSRGYPFPDTPPRSRTQSARDSSSSKVTTSTDSPSVSIGTITPTLSPVVPTAALPGVSSRSAASPDAGSPSGSHSASPPPSDTSAKSSSSHIASPLSITELYAGSPNVWFADPSPQGVVVKVATARGRTTSSRMDHGGRRGVEARTQTAAADVQVAEVEASSPAVDAEAVVERTPKVVQDLAWIPEEEDEIAMEKEKERQKGKEKERRRRTTKSSTTKSRSPSSMDASPPRPAVKERVHSKGKDRADRSDRSRPTKSKALGPTPTFSTWAVSPTSRDKRVVASRPHVLGAPDPIMERERQREEGQFAKDVVMAHRERDREYARHSHSHRVSHKMRIASAPTDEFTTVYDAGHGRGLGRGERGGRRGHGRSASSVAMSVLSDGETMVHSEDSETMDAIEAVLSV